MHIQIYKQIILLVILYFEDTCVERPTNVDQLQKGIILCGAFLKFDLNSKQTIASLEYFN